MTFFNNDINVMLKILGSQLGSSPSPAFLLYSIGK